MALSSERFVEVRLRHDYYRDGACPVLRVVPTPTTAALITARRLRFQPRADGFSLIGQVEQDGEGNVRPRFPLEPRDRFVFALALTEPDFLYFTDLPLEGGPGQRYLLRNREGSSVLSSGAAVGTGDRVRLTPPQLTVKVPASAIGASVVVEDEAGAPRASAPVPSFEGDSLELPLSLGGFSGVARLRVGAGAPEPLFVDAELPGMGPFGLLELRPLGGTWPPSRVVNGKLAIATVELTADFRRRSTRWRYHVVAPADWPDTATLDILYPEDVPAPYPEDVTFARTLLPEIIALFPDKSVVSFESSQALPLHETALRNTRLEIRRGTLLPQLPNAPRNTLKRTDTAQLVSDIFVPL
ncbi:MAG: hypothetical protein JXB05_32955 [Myxococcaceae bacterium]|nr:hypothetical protein [Myxococcaceae bacterium]